MPRKPSVPSYRLHKPSGQAVVTVPLPGGGRRDVYLGPHDTPDSHKEYARVVAELAAASAGVPAAGPGPARADLTVDELLLAFWRHAERHYRRDDGTPTSEVDGYRQAFKPLRALYGHAPAAGFGPKALAAVRRAMVERGWSRKVVNQRVGRVKRAFKWAAAEELVPVAAYQALATLAGLQAGRSAAKELPPVEPVPDGHVERALPFLSRHVRGLVRFMTLTGCRPGEACRLTRGQVDTSADPWLYRPTTHKTRWRGRGRVIPIGPRAQALLVEFPTAGPDDPVFSPAVAREERYAAMRAARKSKVQPSQQYRRKADPRRKPGAFYRPEAVAHAVAKACAKVGVPHWFPNMVRHAVATEVRRAHGLEAAQVLLGHARADVTQLYAEKNLALAAAVAAQRG